MTSPEALVRGLLEPLLDGREQPATARFDDALASALRSGRITPELARELRFWQRASVHEVTDHVRTVLPAVLPVALLAVAEADAEAATAATAAMDAWQDRTPVVEAGAETATEAEVEPADPQPSNAAEAAPDALRAEPIPEPEAHDERDNADEDDEDDEHGASASTPPLAGAAMSPNVRRRLFVAGLTSTA